MRLMHGSIRKILTAFAALAVVGSATSLPAEKTGEGAVKVLRIGGEARYTADGKTWIPLKKGIVLKGGVIVQTAPRSLVDLCFNEGHPTHPHDGMETTTDHVIRLFENSALKISRLEKKKDGADISSEIQLELPAGMIMGTVGKLHPASVYEIKLAHGFVGVREGTYMTSSSGVLNVVDGSAVIVKINADGSMTTKKVGKLQGFDPETGNVVALSVSEDPGGIPKPLTCSESDSPMPGSTAPPSPTGLPRGPGMGGSLRKF